jgi:biotin carboxylase
VHAVIAQLEFSVEATAIACERLGLRFTSAQGVRNARNKARARSLIQAAGLASTRFAVAHDVNGVANAAQRFGYPVIVKLLSGADSIMAYRADNAGEARAAAAEIVSRVRDISPQVREQFGRGILVEEYVTGELVSAEIGFLDGASYRFMVTGRALSDANECVEMGAVLPANIPDSQAGACFDYAESVCRTLGLDLGIFHIEMMLTDQGPVLIEANPRLMGGLMTTLYEILTGHNISDDLISIHLGRPITGDLPSPAGFVTARKVMPLADGRLPGQLDLSWLDDPGGELAQLFNYRLLPGADVRRLQVLARAAVSAPTWGQAMARADALVDRFEMTLGLRLAKTSRGA